MLKCQQFFVCFHRRRFHHQCRRLRQLYPLKIQKLSLIEPKLQNSDGSYLILTARLIFYCRFVWILGKSIYLRFFQFLRRLGKCTIRSRCENFPHLKSRLWIGCPNFLDSLRRTFICFPTLKSWKKNKMCWRLKLILVFLVEESIYSNVWEIRSNLTFFTNKFWNFQYFCLYTLALAGKLFVWMPCRGKKVEKVLKLGITSERCNLRKENKDISVIFFTQKTRPFPHLTESGQK